MRRLKIVELVLENFIPVLAGMGKERICLDLRDRSTRINVLIGKIGSGKTYILSHLQPFATVGTLDIRNADDPIIEGKDGYKRIVYEADDSEYVITHHYTWTGSNHAKKSYVEKDGVELNPNGNISTFNDIIQMEFGIDQSFLRLIRIGPNVTNFINMKATERKAFIASLLKDTEFYLSLYKYWSAELRTINTKVSILMNKLNTFGNKSIDEMTSDMEKLEDTRKKRQTKIDDLKQKRSDIKAESNSFLNGLSIQDFHRKRKDIGNEIETLVFEMDNIKASLESFKDYPDLEVVIKEIGRYDSKLSTDNEMLQNLSKTYEEVTENLNTALDRKAISEDKNHMQTLNESYQELLEKATLYEKKLKGFKCEYSSAQLTSLLEEINTMNVLINEISQYDSEIIGFLYDSDSSVLNYAKEKIEILNLRKLKVQKLMNNLRFSDKYEAPSTLFFPPFCPTKSCPYYVTHPETLQKSIKGKDALDDQLLAYQSEIQELDVQIYKYNDYPIIYSKISSLKSYWKKVSPILSSIKALNCDSLRKALTLIQYQVWYNYDKIIDTIDLIEIRDQYYELTEKIKQIKNELNQLELSRDESLDNTISRLKKEKAELEEKIDKTEKERLEDEKKVKSYNSQYVELSKKSEYDARLSTLTVELDKAISERDDLEEKARRLDDNIGLITTLDQHILEHEGKLKETLGEIDTLRTKMNDISYTTKELDGLLEEQKWMTYMVDAVGSKKGIPMKMVKMFFDSCRGTINDMLYMVSEDEFEILDFRIGEKEFTIPYVVNGSVADDISKASQGQTSIVSTALSFALVKELGLKSDDGYYSIPLLDEPDAALHKNDKPKLISIIMKYLDDIGSEQCFVITHDENTFDGYPVQIIMTTDESVNKDRYANAIHL